MQLLFGQRIHVDGQSKSHLLSIPSTLALSLQGSYGMGLAKIPRSGVLKQAQGLNNMLQPTDQVITQLALPLS